MRPIGVIRSIPLSLEVQCSPLLSILLNPSDQQKYHLLLVLQIRFEHKDVHL